MTKLVVVAGAKHVGSTMLVNIIRYILDEVLKTHYISYTTSGKINADGKNIPINKGYDYTILKIHRFARVLLERSDLVFIPIRDIRDVSISAWKRNKASRNIEDQIQNMKKNIMFFNSWKKNDSSLTPKTVIFKYEKYKSNEQEGIRFVTKQLDIILNYQQIDQVVNKVNNLMKTPNKGACMSNSNITQKGQINKWKALYTEAEKQQVLEDPHRPRISNKV